MVLSKDNTNGKEDLKLLELTTAQKRRLRRKKLKAARAGTLNTDISTKKDIIDLNKHPNKSISNQQEHVSTKRERHKGDNVLNSQGYTFEKISLNNNQEAKCGKPVLSNDLKSTSQSPVSTKNLKCPTRETKNKELKSQNSHSITNENKLHEIETPLTIVKENPECKKNNSRQKQQPKLNGDHQIKPDSQCIIENNKNKSIRSLLTEKQIADSLKVTEKQADLPHHKLHYENQVPELKGPIEIKTDTSNDKDHVLIKEQTIIGSSEGETHTTKVDILKLDNQEAKAIIPESIENIPVILDKSNMGKIQDTPGPQKQHGGLNKVESKKEETSSADTSAKSREDIKAAREAKKLAKQKAKKKEDNVGESVGVKTASSKTDVKVTQVKENVAKNQDLAINKTEKTKSEPVNDLQCKENVPPIEKTKVEDKIKENEVPKESVKSETTAEKGEDAGKSKAELRAERRAKQEAQRAAKQSAQKAKPVAEQKAAAPEAKTKEPAKVKEEKTVKPKSTEKSKSKTQSVQKVGWFQHLYVEKASLNNIPINSNLHPAVVKLGVQLAERVVTGSNARCIALLDAVKKMVRDYSLPARTEFGRGLQAQLAGAAAHLAAARTPAAAELNALKHVRRQLTLLPANVDEFDAKKQLQEEIDRYIREQIDMAGEAISLFLRSKISPGDHILTYGCSSLIERALVAAWAAGVRFRATVAGARGQCGPELLRRLRARGLPAAYVDISALSYIMADVQKVVLGASALLAHGAALGAAGSAQVALLARARNVPVLVACETHKFSERTHLDPLVCHEIGDPDELIDKSDPSSPLRDWRSNPNLTLLNVTHDVTPPALVTAVVTELGVLPCTSAPVVLRFKQAEYGI